MDIHGLRQGFSTSLSNTTDSAFDWSKASHSFWSQSQDKRINTYCSPWHTCEFKQVVGVCGPFDVPTPVIRFSESPIFGEDPDTNLITFRGDSQVRVYDRQMFIEMSMKNSSEIPSDLEWESAQECPMGSAIIGGKIGTAGEGGVLTGIKVYCGHIMPVKGVKGQRTGYENAKSLSFGGLRVESEYKANLTKTGGSAVGFRVQMFEDEKYEYDLAFTRNSPSEPGIYQVTCPASYALCGIQPLVSRDYGNYYSD